MESAIKILQQIEQDKIESEKYLLSGTKDGSRYSRAVEIIEHELNQTEKCLLAARREIEKSRKYRSRRHWVIKTQFIYNRMAEENHLSCTWISESKIKRRWLHYVSLVAEIAIRLDERQK